MKEPEDYYVVFIDILGFKNLVNEHFSENTNSYSLPEKIKKVIDEAFRISDIMLRNCEKDIMFISDSLIISMKKETDYNNLSLLLAFLSNFQAICLIEGIYLRGAVSFGKHSMINEQNYKIVISNPLINTVSLEKNTAINPRIIIDDMLIRELINTKDSSNGVFIVAENNEYFIDFYFGIITWYLYYEKRESMKEIITKIVIDIEKNINKYKIDNSITSKYTWLLQFLAWRSIELKELDELFIFEKLSDQKITFKSLFKSMEMYKKKDN